MTRLAALAFGLLASCAYAQTPTHRLSAALAMEAAEETVAACAKQNYHETADVVDASSSKARARSRAFHSNVARCTIR